METPAQWRKRTQSAHYLAVDVFQRELIKGGALLYDLLGLDDPLPGPAPRMAASDFNHCVIVAEPVKWQTLQSFLRSRTEWVTNAHSQFVELFGDVQALPRLPLPQVEKSVQAITAWRSVSKSTTTEPARDHQRAIRKALSKEVRSKQIDKLEGLLERVAMGESVQLRLRSPGIQRIHLGATFDTGTTQRYSARRVGFICTSGVDGFELSDDGPGARRRRRKRSDSKNEKPLFKTGHREFFGVP